MRTDRSIRNIPVPTAHRRTAPRPQYDEKEERFDEERPRPRRRRRLGRRLWLIGAGVVAVCIIGGLLLSTVFSGATVRVSPRTEKVTPPATLEARLGAPVGMLTYQNLIIRRFATTTIAASGTAYASRQAQGSITIYNTFSGVSQRLIANTRFEAPDAKIYRIRNSVAVPGTTKNADGSLKAGTVIAIIYADSPGADYNRPDSTRFTIPGFKGDPRYDKFYAQSQGTISGGFVGNEPAVPPADLAKAQTTLKLELDSALDAAASAEIPEGFLPIPGTLVITYADIMKTQDGNNATLSQGAQATGAIVRANDFATALARAALAGKYKGEAVVLQDPSQISISLAASSSQADGALRLALSGAPTLIWQFDPAAVKTALVGKKLDALSQIISSFSPAIVQARATVRPFWQGSFPSDPNKITVTVEE